MGGVKKEIADTGVSSAVALVLLVAIALVLSVISNFFFVYLGVVWSQQAGLTGTFFDVFIGVIAGMVAWFAGFVVIIGITLSIRGVSFREHNQRRENSKTNDEYGHKHAARILNNNNQ